ncbi:CBS domain-containing protein [Aliidiomarina sanyensis]|uniref:CBS domain-containing protein n=1 Tax=Aliidiomarina sanyensis TaxID=1249555 RepID=A0A432WS38_9GAMM|nr:CBS domain-containing protein [Aliidiomarina sanyensis]RUO36580.1 CBS domain-containing protein [Aliidiomarina sanyensis]
MRSVKVQDYMNRHPVKFTRSMPVETAVSMLVSANQSGGPVIDEHGAVIGFLSEQDCLAMMLEGTYHKEQSATVEDCMSAEVVTVNSDMAILDLAQQLGNQRPKVYPVVDYANQLVGVISRTDVLRAIDLHLRDSYANH